MKNLDDAVLEAFSERVLTTARLKQLASALFSRASNRREHLQAELRDLNREKRETRKALDNLYQAIADGVDLDASLRSHIETLQSRYGELKRLVDRTTGKLNMPDREPSPEQFEMFRWALKNKLSDPENPGLRKAYLRSFISRVELRGDEVWSTGSKAALYEHLTAPQPLPPKVLSSGQEWRTRQDSNL